MGKSYRYDPDGDGFADRATMKRAKKAEKIARRAHRKEDTRLDGGDNKPEPFDVLATIDQT